MGTALSKRRREFILPKCFAGPRVLDTQDTIRLWERSKLHNDPSAFQQLVEHYLLDTRFIMYRLRKRIPAFTGSEDDMLSNATLGLMEAIKRGALPETLADLPAFRIFAGSCMKNAIFTALRDANPGLYYRCQKRKFADSIRQRLVIQLGRMPSDSEISAEMALHVKNPQIYLGNSLHDPMANLQNSETQIALRHVAGDGEQPVESLLAKELMDLALHGLKGLDRKILKGVLEGKNAPELARKYGGCATTMNRRINGLLWTIRKRADVGQYIGIDANKEPDELKVGRWTRIIKEPAKYHIAIAA